MTATPYDVENPGLDQVSKALPAAPPVELRYFAYAHLPVDLRNVSAGFHTLALDLVQNIPDGDQRKWALHYLLLAKDAAVRAAMKKD